MGLNGGHAPFLKVNNTITLLMLKHCQHSYFQNHPCMLGSAEDSHVASPQGLVSG